MWTYQPSGTTFTGPRARPAPRNQPTAPRHQATSGQIGELTTAILSSDLDRARELLRRSPAEINALDGNGMGALHYALAASRLEAVKLLLANGADPNLVSRTGMRPLTIATARPELELTRLLLGKGADPNAHERAGTTGVLDFAVASGRSDLAALLRQHGARGTISR